MAPLMRWADIAISAAGGACWELAYLGVPTILIVISSDQAANASAMADHHAAISLGWHANLSEHYIANATRSLSGNADLRRAMSQCGQRLVDGRGAARVVEFLLNCL
jgi:UDP-2,4-diacetamido-2,4,6-trideoxy-beta-L-altropyranose hydrolase